MPHSTRLENLRWDAAGARLDIDGRSVGLSAEQHGPALAAIQAFYDEALSAYGSGAVVNRPSATRLPEWLRPSQWARRIRSLFAQMLSHATGHPLAQAAPAVAAIAKPPAPPAPPHSPQAAGPAPRPLETPALRSAYADEAGVHVIWAAGGPGKRAKETELLYAFDSTVAARLQACYSGLAELGYDVVDLRVWRKEAHVETPGPARPSPAVPTTKPDAARVMRLHPEPGDTPGRAVVSPVGDDKNLQVLTAPERLVAALHAAADAKRPADERLTHLRCAASRGALKVVAVGLGENKDDPTVPGRWENIATWWDQAKKTLQPVAAAGSPKPSPEPELF